MKKLTLETVREKAQLLGFCLEPDIEGGYMFWKEGREYIVWRCKTLKGSLEHMERSPNS